MGKPQPPAPPDPTQVAAAQTQSNEQTGLFQSQLNNGNSTGPYGSVSNVYDPKTNQWNQTTTLSAPEQNIFNQQTQAEGSALQLGDQQLGRVGQALSQTVHDPSLQTNVGGNTDQAVNQAIQSNFAGQMNLLGPQMQQAAEHQNANLVAQGLNPNDAAYQNSQQLFGNQQATELQQAASSAVGAGDAEQNTLFGQQLNQGQFNNQALQQGFQNQNYSQQLPINEFNALMSSGQVQGPSAGQFAQTGVAPTDVTGAYALSQQAAQANYQSQMQQYQSGLGGLFNLGSSAMLAFSDERLKEDIEPVGEWQGFPLYDYHYKGEDEPSRGVMAQDVIRSRPDAVHRTPSGYLAVDYGKLGGLYDLGAERLAA